MGLTLFQVDAFTAKPFAGNPAAVCILPQPMDENWMQNVAREMNLSETAFLLRQEEGFQLRWFTPAVEVDLCGHATLASAYVITRFIDEGKRRIAFRTLKAGTLVVTREGDELEIDFARGLIRNLTRSEEYHAQAFPPFVEEIIRAGGLVEAVKQKTKKRKSGRAAS